MSTAEQNRISYALSKQIPSMVSGFTIYTSYGDLEVEAGDAILFMELAKSLLEEKLVASQPSHKQQAKAIKRAFGGPITPVGTAIKLSARDLAIWNDFTGQNHSDLARKYGVSLQWIYRIVKAIRKTKDNPDPSPATPDANGHSHLTANKVRCRHCRLLTTENASGSTEPWCTGLGVFRHPERERICKHFAPTYYFETELGDGE